jgi:hypothetical protein
MNGPSGTPEELNRKNPFSYLIRGLTYIPKQIAMATGDNRGASANRKDRRKESQSGLKKTQSEEERLRQAAMSRMGARSAELAQEGLDLEKNIAAAAGRGAAAAAGRRSGMASGGGKMAALAGIEGDLQQQAAEARAGLSQRQYDQEMGRLQFERETMKSEAQTKQERMDNEAKLKEFYDASRTLGVLDEKGFEKRVDDYIRSMNISASDAAALKQSMQTMIEEESFFF